MAVKTSTKAAKTSAKAAKTSAKVAVEEQTGLSIEERLRALYQLQQIDSKIDKIKRLRGELPLEVQDLEDAIQGLETRIQNYHQELTALDTQIAERKQGIKEANGLIKKYEEQQKNVRNNREFDSITKEIEFQVLEIELCEKRIREHLQQKVEKEAAIEHAKGQLAESQGDLQLKKTELENIIAETQKEEEELLQQLEAFEKLIEPRVLSAYKRIRSNARNGLAVATVQRDACGGCFNKIPPQRQLDIKLRKKIIVCEHCGRIMVDADIMEAATVEE